MPAGLSLRRLGVRINSDYMWLSAKTTIRTTSKATAKITARAITRATTMTTRAVIRATAGLTTRVAAQTVIWITRLFPG